jgi:hypothetical protein
MLLSAFDVRIIITSTVATILTVVVGYYLTIPVFKLWPMKILSNLLGQLWEVDPNKSLWSLMAKAWSEMRDQIGKNNVPLDQFFKIICPLLNLPSPETYLEGQGWKLEINQEGIPILLRDPTAQPPASLITEFADMPLSVEDITSICQTMGYAQGYVPGRNTASSTFLGRSLLRSSQKSARPLYMTAAGFVQNAKVVKRKDNRKDNRKDKRETAGQSGMGLMLREQIINAHGGKPSSVPHADEPSNTVAEPSGFYNQMAALFTHHMSQDASQTVHSSAQNATATLVTNTSSHPVFTDRSAFRRGADENATLPPFHPFGL